MASPHRSPRASQETVEGARFLIVEARFYEKISAPLLDGATAAFRAARASYEIVTVPGALEIPLAIAIALDNAA
ncbi:MAG: 6,7-dimethyl-8-ribityllumazine synthase, partial [Methylocapsa sp.]|nr:6,7-dimethyl-8-ribityllumazine synthase [Methylocapsa sp.]